MKRALAITLIIMLLLSACAPAPTPTPTPTPAPTETPLTFMDLRVPAGEGGNAWYVPCAALEELENQELAIIGDTLVVSANLLDGMERSFALRLISLRDGTLLCSENFPSSGYVFVQAFDGLIGLCDPGLGVARVLDLSGKVLRSYETEPANANWYFNQNMEILYSLDWETGVTAIKLADGSVSAVMPDATRIYIRGLTRDSVSFSYTDRVSQRAFCRTLSLADGSVGDIPYRGDVNSADTAAGAWLLGDWNEWGLYHIVNGETRAALRWEGGRIKLLPARAELFAADPDSRVLTLCALDGGFISKCELPKSETGYSYAGDPVWSELWGGYFFVDSHSEQRGGSQGRLAFWDVSKPSSGEGITLAAEKSDVFGGQSAAPELYARAAEMSERFGVDIRIADMCTLNYVNYTAIENSDFANVMRGLDALERALSAYPQGFLSQLLYGNIQSLQIELVGFISAKPDAADTVSVPAAFASEQSDRYLLIADITLSSESTFWHELTHIMDSRLAWDAVLRPESQFGEESWQALQPEGFSYAYSYNNMPPETSKYFYSGYFARPYACTFPTEDRATMMETAMFSHQSGGTLSPGLLAKLGYYSRCLRDCLDDSAWPETTLWEEALSR